jgi:septal ring factor EnvC (AmiA/AmiB activator)
MDRAYDKLEEMLKKLEGAHIIREMRKTENISIFKGKLPKPILGKIVHPFGPVFDTRTKTELPHPGLDIETKTGTPVTSIFSGVVLFSDWFSGYGNLIIIDHGMGYVSLYAHLAERSVKTGNLIELKQKIGSIHKSHLYFEMRYQGRAIDPMEWIIHSK